MHAQKSFSSSTCLRVVLSVGGRSGTPQCTVNQLQVELLANVGWKYWQMNKFQYISNGRSVDSFHPSTHPLYTPCTPRGNDFSSSPCQAAAGNGSVVGDFVRCYVGRSVCPTLATIPWSFCPLRRPPLPTSTSTLVSSHGHNNVQ